MAVASGGTAAIIIVFFCSCQAVALVARLVLRRRRLR